MAGEALSSLIAGAPLTDREFQVWDHGRHQGIREGMREIERLRAVIAAAYDDLEAGNEASAFLILKHAVPSAKAKESGR